jgi:hypothetical protein
LVLGFVVLLFFGFSAISVWAQTSNNTVRITMTGISDFNGSDGRILLSTSNDLDDDDASVAVGYIDKNGKIASGWANFTLTDWDDKPFTRPGRYYVFLHIRTVVNRSVVERFFVSKHQVNITGDRLPQPIAFNYDVFSEVD